MLACISRASVVIEDTSLKHELKGNSDNLGRSIRRVSGGGVDNRIFDLIDQVFEHLIAVAGSSESLIIVLQRGGGNVSICIIEMIQ